MVGKLADAGEALADRFTATVEGLKGDAEDVVEAFTSIGDTKEFLDAAADGLENLREQTVAAALAARTAEPAVRERAEIEPGTVGRQMPMPMDGGDEEGQRFGERFAESFTTVFRQAIDGESVDFIGSFAELLGDASEEALKDSFQEAVDGFGDLLKSAVGASGLGGLFEMGGAFGGVGTFLKDRLGEESGKVLGGAALGILGAGISAFRREQDVRSMAAGVTSAVDSAERVRGIVTGPTSIAIAQVDRGIADAFIEPTRLLALIEENTRRTARSTSDTGTGSVPSGGTSEATQALANEGPSLV